MSQFISILNLVFTLVEIIFP